MGASGRVGASGPAGVSGAAGGRGAGAPTLGSAPAGPGWHDAPGHRRWLWDQANALLDFHWPAAIDPAGGFHEPADDGTPRATEEKQLYLTLRMAHVAALAQLAGRPGAAEVLDHALAFVRGPLADERHGGWYWSVGPDGPRDASKQHYGHAFAIVAGASATLAGHPDGRALLDEALAVHDRYFWDDAAGMGCDAYAAPDWSGRSAYRGQNGNMHLTEALMAAYEATGEPRHLDRAERIARRLIDREARRHGWRLPEHFDADWNVDLAYNRETPSDPFRPYGWIVGHSLEWSRLLLTLWVLRGRRDGDAWMPDAAVELFDHALAEGWDRERGGLFYTVDWDGTPVDRNRQWWTIAEGAAAASFLVRIDGDPRFETAYRRFWDFSATHLIDRRHGGWHHQLDPCNRPVPGLWGGKPDLYHAFQACLIPLLPPDAGPAAALRAGRLRL